MSVWKTCMFLDVSSKHKSIERLVGMVEPNMGFQLATDLRGFLTTGKGWKAGS
jgi:hypothetical protein